MEEKKKNMYVSVAYKLYAIENGKEQFIEEATVENPYKFLSGFGMVLPAFEQALAGKQKGDEFEVTIAKEDAYGEHDDEAVVELDREIFTVDGRFDSRKVFPGAVIPLLNEEGQRFQASIVDVLEETVVVDLNYPLAGKSLRFAGHVVENREATNEEIQTLVMQMSGECCSDCEGGCGGKEGGCGGCRK